LVQGKPLSEQEIDVIEGLRTGDVVADIPEQELAQLVALPTDVKAILAEQNTTQHNNVRNGSERTAATVAMGQQAQYVNAQEMKHAAAQAPMAQHADKLASAPMPDALVANNFNPAVQMAANGEVSHKAINAALSAGALKATASQQDKPESQYGLAGQLQAAAGQQGVTAQQQTRAEAAQQAQLPLQLTKELANEQVTEKVQMMMSKNLKNLDIRLDPPELGRMQIRMTMNNDLANVHFTVTNPQARDIIEQTLPRLREMLAQQGMQLADSSVQQQSSGQQQSGYAAAEQHGQGTSGRGFSGQSDENFDADVNLDLNVVSKRDGISFYA
ncbi:flagellar hook-length control FliK family protein, partial [Vibrio parahaemolyticus AQ3810]|uniref:flagellar hook-length control protein FliK n=1 Tax=Vibrio parahaemolyticus TaxID=670 RepID=UPI00042DFC2C